MKKKAPFISLLFAFLLMFSVSMAASAAPVSVGLENSRADISTIQGETPSEPEASDGVQSEAETASAPSKNNNTPFFMGAGIAVLMFVGVALYCKKNGHKTF